MGRQEPSVDDSTRIRLSENHAVATRTKSKKQRKPPANRGFLRFQGGKVRQGWLKEMLHGLRHGREARTVRRLEDLLQTQSQRTTEDQKTISREVSYFQDHREHLHYSTDGKSRSTHGKRRCRVLG